MPFGIILVALGLLAYFSGIVRLAFWATVTISLAVSYWYVWRKKPATFFDGEFQPVQDLTYGFFFLAVFLSFAASLAYTVYRGVLLWT